MVGIQLLTVLVVGLLTALALQCVLTTLGTAIALSNWRLEPTAESSGGITTGVGFGVLLTVNVVLFTACFLATRFSGVDTVLSGAIAGLVVWAAYLLLVLWVGAIALRSVVGTLFTVTTGGLGRLIKAIQAAFQSPVPDPLSESEIRATMRQEIQAALVAWQPVLPVPQPAPLPPPQPAVVPPPVTTEPPEPDPLWAELATYLQTTSVKNLTPKRLERKLQKWFQGHPAVPQFTKLELIQVLMQRQDLSAKQRQRILAQLQAAWTPQPEPTRSAEHPIATKVMQAVVSQAVGEVVAQVEPGRLVEKAVEGLRSQSSESEPGEDGVVTTALEDWLQRSVHQVETMQQAAKEQLATLQQQTQQQLDQTRQTAAAAAWWLFFTAASSALSAAVAGTWATGTNPLQLLGVAQG